MVTTPSPCVDELRTISLEMPCNPCNSPSKVPYLYCTCGGGWDTLGARAIVVKMALGALGQRSPIRLLFACPHIVDLGDILPLEGLLLVTMVVYGGIISLPLVVRLPFRLGAEFLIHQVIGQLNSLIQCLGSGRLDVPINFVGSH
ncbi:hypothetical protein Tco_1533883 [Tanacetum coccineum]